MLIAFTDIA